MPGSTYTVGAAIHDCLSSTVAITITPPATDSSVTATTLNSSLDTSACSMVSTSSGVISSPSEKCDNRSSVVSVTFERPSTLNPTIRRGSGGTTGASSANAGAASSARTTARRSTHGAYASVIVKICVCVSNMFV